MSQPTYAQLRANALAELNKARHHLSEAASWLRSDWAEGTSPSNAGGMFSEGAVRIGQAKDRIDQAKNELDG